MNVRKSLVIFGISILVATCILSSTSGADRRAIGQVTLAGSDLYVSGYPATAGTTLFVGDQVITGRFPAVLALPAGTRIKLEPNTEVDFAEHDEKLTVYTRRGLARKSPAPRRIVLDEPALGATPQLSQRSSSSSPPSDGSIVTLVVTSQSQQTQDASPPCPPNNPHCR